MRSMEPTPTTLREAIIYYSDLTACTKRMIASRWPNGVACIHCGVIGPKFMRSVQRFKCYACKKQFSVTVGTIFEDSLILLTKWLPAVWLLTGAKNGIENFLALLNRCLKGKYSGAAVSLEAIY